MTHEVTTTHGGIAQLGERLHGMQEVRSSILLVSTIRNVTVAVRDRFIFVRPCQKIIDFVFILCYYYFKLKVEPTGKGNS